MGEPRKHCKRKEPDTKKHEFYEAVIESSK